MKDTIWNKHIPTLLAISIIVLGIAITSFLVKSGVIFISQAHPAETPQKLKITNISDTSFTVSYSTEDNVIGSVNFGKDENLGSTAFDDRNQKTESVAPYKIHSITVKNLTPETRYYFSITSGQKKFLNNAVPFEVSTAPTLKTLPPSQTLSLKGKVILPNAEKVTEAIVYATTQNGQAISTVLKKDGSYLLPLDSMRTSDFSSYFTFGQNSVIKMLIENDIFKSNVSVSGKPQIVPTVTLSYDYDFTISPEPVASGSEEHIGFPSIPVAEKSVLSASTGMPQIILPQKNQEFTDQQPEFRGTTIPNAAIKITIQSSQNLVTQITSDDYGNWKYRPTKPLSPGRHTITIVARDAFGALKTITQSFVVHAQGTQVNQSATPSATPTLALPQIPTRTPTPTPTKTPTPTPGIGGPITSPSPTPTPILIAQNLTPTPTPITTSLTTTPTPTLCPGCPTPTPTPTLCPGCPTHTPTSPISLSPTTTTQLTPVPTIAPPGDSSVVTVGILGVAVAAIGGLLFLLTRTGI